MVRVELLKHDHQVFGYEVSGHAGYAESGQDIVCSAVSILAYTGINTLLDRYECSITYEIDEGYILLKLEQETLENCKEASVVLETIAVGFESILESYPEYITLKSREV
ncbi:MAG: ribosomal-processing cysteine protease Prp [Tissierellales bacterium]|jgi:uncharacterized protein YsxB (DUF464 family)|nr:ribosomal-processing cysteine protease Prp [Tissierellales bacterium]